MRFLLFTCLFLTTGGCTSNVEGPKRDSRSMATGTGGSTAGPNGTAPGTGGSAPLGSGGSGAAPGNPPTQALFECPAVVADKAPVRRVWRLTPEQFLNTAAGFLSSNRRSGTAAFPTVPAGLTSPLLPADAKLAYSTTSDTVTIAGPEFSKLLPFVETISDQLVQGLKSGSCWATDSTGANLDTCLSTVLQDKGSLLYRRLLTTEELTFYGDIVRKDADVATPVDMGGGAGVGADGALSLAFQAMMLAPETLFQPEIGADPGGTKTSRLTPFEVASSLAYSLTAGPPDAELWDAASQGLLTTADQIKTHAARLLAGPVASGARNFVTEYFELRRLLEVPKTADLNATGCQYQRTQIVKNAEALVDDLFTTNASSNFLATLFSAPTQFYNCATEGVLGVTGGPMPDQAPVKGVAPAGQRAGLLTHPALMGALATRDATMPVRRGQFINEQILCREVPPVDLAAIPMIDATGLTQRERLAAHTGAGAVSCSGCHSILDDAGLAFENYDTLGAYRTMDQVTATLAKPIDAHGVLTGAGDADGPFQNAVELTTRLSTSVTVQQCVMKNSFRYFLGRSEFGYDSCTLFNAQKAYTDGGGSYVEFIAALLTSDSFMNRSY